MSQSFVITLVGPDRTGIVEQLASRVFRLGANWDSSRMVRLGGQFAGIVRIFAPTDVGALLEALREFESSGIRILATADHGDGGKPPGRERMIDLLGSDRPGIVRELTACLLTAGVNIEELETHTLPAPMEGGILFQASIHVRVPPSVSDRELRSKLESVANDLMVELSLEEQDSQS